MFNKSTKGLAAADIVRSINASSARRSVPAAPVSAPSGKAYSVKAGDTLSQLAKDNSTTVEAIAELNDIEDVNKIQVGQTLELPTALVEASQTQGVPSELPTAPIPEVSAPEALEPLPEVSEPQQSRMPNAVPREKPAQAAAIMKDSGTDSSLISPHIRMFGAFLQNTLEHALFGEVEPEPITEADFSEEELAAAKAAVARARANGRDYVMNEDWGKDIAANLQSLNTETIAMGSKDVSAAMALTIGRANIEEDAEGNLFLVDTYDFSKIEKAPEGFAPYARIRKWAGDIGQEGAMPVRIALGK